MSTLARALEIAHEAHAGQVDKAGRPYIEHVLRVMDAVEGDDAKIVAALHDVLEDCPAWRDEALLITPYHLLPDVLSLCHCEGQSYASYIGDVILRGGIARDVKIADLLDNADPSRLALLPEKDQHRLRRKYAKALEALGVWEVVIPIERAHELRLERQVRWVVASINEMADDERRELHEAVQFTATVIGKPDEMEGSDG